MDYAAECYAALNAMAQHCATARPLPYGGPVGSPTRRGVETDNPTTTTGRQYAEPSDRISPEKAKQILRDDNCRYARRFPEDVRYASNPTPPARYSPYPRDSFGRPRGVMAPISMDQFTGGHFGYSHCYDSDDVRRRFS